MAEMDLVRFVAGDEQEDAPVKVWQGFDAASSTGSSGFDMVYVTADTLRQMAAYDFDTIKDDPWMALHNAPEGFWHRLAFGDPGARFAPDGVTAVYPIGEWTSTIVQRFNPDAGRSYDIVSDGVKVGVGHFGEWENEANVLGIPEPVGFVVNPEDWAQDRGDTPPFDRVGEESE